MVLTGAVIHVKSSAWLIANVICVFSPILMREVSVTDKRDSNTNLPCLPPPPQSLSVSAQGSNCNLNQQFLSNPILLLIDLLNLIGCLLGGGIINLFLCFSDSDIDNIRQDFSISKRSLAAYLSYFSDSLFLSGAGIPDPCAKGDDRLMNCRYKVEECTAAYILFNLPIWN